MQSISIIFFLFYILTSVTLASGSEQICSTVDKQLNVNIPCVTYQEQAYRAKLNFLPDTDHSKSLCWTLANAATTSDNGSCATASDDLNLDLPCVDVNGISYKANLKNNNSQTEPPECLFILDKAELAAVHPFVMDLIPSSGIAEDSNIKVEGFLKADGTVGHLSKIIVDRDDEKGTIDITLDEQGQPLSLHVDEGTIIFKSLPDGQLSIISSSIENAVEIIPRLKEVRVSNETREGPFGALIGFLHTRKYGEVVVQCDQPGKVFVKGEKILSTGQKFPFAFHTEYDTSFDGKSVYKYSTPSIMRYPYNEWKNACDQGIEAIYDGTKTILGIISIASPALRSFLAGLPDDMFVRPGLIQQACNRSIYDQEVDDINEEYIVGIQGTKAFYDSSKKFNLNLEPISINNKAEILPTIELGPAAPNALISTIEVNEFGGRTATTETQFDKPVVLDLRRHDQFRDDDESCATYNWYIYNANDLSTPVADLGSEKKVQHEFREGQWLIRLESSNVAGSYIDERMITVGNKVATCDETGSWLTIGDFQYSCSLSDFDGNYYILQHIDIDESAGYQSKQVGHMVVRDGSVIRFDDYLCGITKYHCLKEYEKRELNTKIIMVYDEHYQWMRSADHSQLNDTVTRFPLSAGDTNTRYRDVPGALHATRNINGSYIFYDSEYYYYSTSFSSCQWPENFEVSLYPTIYDEELGQKVHDPRYINCINATIDKVESFLNQSPPVEEDPSQFFYPEWQQILTLFNLEGGGEE